jgi:hypothetical protein
LWSYSRRYLKLYACPWRCKNKWEVNITHTHTHTHTRARARACERRAESKASMKVLRARVLYHIWFWWLIFNGVQAHHRASSCWAFGVWMWNSHRNSLAVIGFLWWRYFGHKYSVLIKGYWRKFGPERPAAFGKACHHNSWFEQARICCMYLRKFINFSESHDRKVKHWFS